MFRVSVIFVVVVGGFCLSNHGLLAQSGESSKEWPNGKNLREETITEQNSLNNGNGPPSGRENINEYNESWSEIGEVGGERFEIVDGEVKSSGEQRSELSKLNSSVERIQEESIRELSTVNWSEMDCSDESLFHKPGSWPEIAVLIAGNRALWNRL